MYFQIIASICAQIKQSSIWPLGYDDLENQPDATLISFQNNIIEISSIDLKVNMDLGAAVLSDTSGRLLFYSDGCRIANADHEIMAGGDSLNYPGLKFELDCINNEVGYSFFQGLLALPFPKSEHLYVLFQLYSPSRFRTDDPEQILYSIIDMREENGKGKVVVKNRLLWQAKFADRITAVRHGNGRDWWIVAPRADTSAIYHLFLLSPDGISGPQTQQIGVNNMGLSRSQAVFSPDGTKYACSQFNGNTLLMDFDRCAGRFSCPRWIELPPTDWRTASGAAFSPNSRYLYISVPLLLYQFDTESPNSNAKPLLIDEYDGFENLLPTTFHRQMLAPDGKIYMSATNGVYNLHVIESPDETGIACNFRQHGIDLPASGSFGLPNFPYFQLYDLPRSVCDTLGIDAPAGVEAVTWTPPAGVTVQPNPVRDEAYIALASCASGDLRIFDAAGRLMYEQRDWEGPASLLVDVRNWPSGVYYINVHYYKKFQYNTKMVVLH